MISMSLKEAGAVMQAAPFAGDDRVFSGVSIDSRTTAPGNLFFAIAGERFDGHDFCADALAAGAVAVVAARDRLPLDLSIRVRAGAAPDPTQAKTGTDPIVLGVADPLAALTDLARAWRERLPARVIGVTGSNGKTTVKEMIHSIVSVSHPALATRGNLNNHIGVPLTLCELATTHAFAVIEMGTSGPGEIAHLADIARPDVALVNNCGAAHLEKLGSVAGVAREKSAIYAGLRPGGTAVINADDAYADVCREAARGKRMLEFSTDPKSAAEVRLLGATKVDGAVGATEIRFVAQGAELECRLPLPGRHNVSNALAAAACALACDIPGADIRAGLAALVPTAGRVQMLTTQAGACVIHDAYNANPDSLAAGLETLASLSGEHWLVLGEMKELGDDREAVHRRVGADAAKQGVVRLFTFGDMAALAGTTFPGPHEHFATHADLATRLAALSTPQTVMLVKGSRANQLERVVDALVNGGTPT